jgi:dTDP-glucose pyrophosphorylase
VAVDATKVVVLAAGRGTRMRAPAAAPAPPAAWPTATVSGAAARPIDTAQQQAADLGLKPLIPFSGHPFLSHALTIAADAGLRDVCLVVGPGDDPVRRYYAAAWARRLSFTYAVQEAPLGSAHALLSAEAFADGDDFLLINADNHYPRVAFEALCALGSAGLAGFLHDGLLRGNVTADRLAGYAIVEAGSDGWLRDIIEKPAAAMLHARGRDAVFSMTCWRFSSRIFAACRAIGRSTRGEFELPDAVRHAATSMGERFRVVPVDEPVLDLSTRLDIPSVAALLAGRSVHL